MMRPTPAAAFQPAGIAGIGAVLLALVTAHPDSAHAQAFPPHAYIPLEHWSTAFLEHLIDRGVTRDPTPLTRPWTAGAVMRALAETDTIHLTGPERATLRRLTGILRAPSVEVVAGAFVEAGGRAATHARRLEWSLREAGPGDVTPQVGFGLGLQFGPGVLFMHPRIENHLDSDPDFVAINHPLTGRFPEAYGGLRTRYLDLDYGQLARNWGPPGFPGILLSSWPMGYDHLFLDVGPSRARLSMVVAQLDTLSTNRGDTAQRYFIAHRLRVRPARWLDLAIWQGTLISGRHRHLDLWYLNPVKTTFEARDQHRQPANVWIGGEGEIRLGRWRLAGSMSVDDIQIFKSGRATDAEPPSFAITATVARPVGPVRVWLGYTVVSNLMYRPLERSESPHAGGIGLGRNFSDYDQVTLRISAVPSQGIVLEPELTMLRQGEGDLRQPSPPIADFAVTPTLFAGTVARTLRAALNANAVLAGYVSVQATAGVHRTTNLGHVTGASDLEFVGGVIVRWQPGKIWALEGGN